MNTPPVTAVVIGLGKESKNMGQTCSRLARFSLKHL